MIAKWPELNNASGDEIDKWNYIMTKCTTAMNNAKDKALSGENVEPPEKVQPILDFENFPLTMKIMADFTSKSFPSKDDCVEIFHIMFMTYVAPNYFKWGENYYRFLEKNGIVMRTFDMETCIDFETLVKKFYMHINHLKSGTTNNTCYFCGAGCMSEYSNTDMGKVLFSKMVKKLSTTSAKTLANGIEIEEQYDFKNNCPVCIREHVSCFASPIESGKAVYFDVQKAELYTEDNFFDIAAGRSPSTSTFICKSTFSSRTCSRYSIYYFR
tara:strand:- start:1602 stop:2411 length:810 start_codon:yes stop_codon:yes gene_type:complete